MLIYDVLFYALIVTVSIQFIYYTFVFSKLAFAKEDKPSLKNIAISVIVCAKNEAKNLPLLIPKLLEQDYQNFEIVLINDASSDDTLQIMQSFKASNSNIKIVDVANNETFWGNKKYALTLGIKAATHEYLLFTDADCVPESKYWIKSMSSHFNNEKAIIIGYGAYEKKSHSLLNKFIRFETLLTAIQYFSFAKIGLPYMAVGRNLAYRKDTFYKANGFISHIKIKSGDDDLFVNQAATKENIALCLSDDSFTISKAETSFKNWFNQKRRHVSTAHHYKFEHKFLLSLFYCTQLLFWCLAITLLILFFKPLIVISLLLLRFIFQYLIIGKSAKQLHETDTIWLLPFFDFFLVISQFSIFISNLLSKPKHWR